MSLDYFKTGLDDYDNRDNYRTIENIENCESINVSDYFWNSYFVYSVTYLFANSSNLEFIVSFFI